MDGTVIDVQVFTRDGVEKDAARQGRSRRMQLAQVRKDLDDSSASSKTPPSSACVRCWSARRPTRGRA
jgi:hypothetical protein